MANWTPDGHVGQMFRFRGKYVPPSPLMDWPLKWGEKAIVRQRFGAGASRTFCTKRHYPMCYPFAPADVVEFFASYYGPTVRAMAAVAPEGLAGLKGELVDLWSANDLARDGASTCVSAEHLEVVGNRA